MKCKNCTGSFCTLFGKRSHSAYAWTGEASVSSLVSKTLSCGLCGCINPEPEVLKQ